MSSNLVKIEANKALASMTDQDVMSVLKSSLYPGASDNSIKMVLSYCQATGLDPMQKPVHIVPIFDSKAGQMRDVVMPGVGLYRTQASRTGQFAGMSEPEFGPDIETEIGGQKITYPEWCRVTVKRALESGITAEFTAREYWIENYAVKGGKEKSVAPNAMWTKRPRGQLAKCASAQALRIAFPELGAAPTADEMEGKEIDMGVIERAQEQPPEKKPYDQAKFDTIFPQWEKLVLDGKKTTDAIIATVTSIHSLNDEQLRRIKDIGKVDKETGEIKNDPWLEAFEGEAE